MRILFVSANPRWTEQLDLAQELRTLQRSLKGHDVNVSLLPAAQLEDLEEALENTDGDKQIDVVHFCGHADGEKGLYFRDPEGLKVPLSPEKLRQILDKKGVRLAVLNACKTRATAEALILTDGEQGKPAVQAVISTEDLLDDNVGILMTKVLYSELGDRAPLASAFAEAKEIITAPNKTEKDQSRFVYTLHPSGTSQVLFPEERASGAEQKNPQIDDAEQKKFNRYFYVNYLDEQIATLTENVRTNRLILWMLAALFLSLLVLSGAWKHMGEFLVWLGHTLVGEAATPKERPLLDSLQALGQVIPAYYAVLQARWCVHGGIKLRQLTALKELVKKSDEMDPSLQARLDKIMDESVRAADADWKPLFRVILELIGAAKRSTQPAEKNEPQDPETVQA
jgi:hypothetical protein